MLEQLQLLLDPVIQGDGQRQLLHIVHFVLDIRDGQIKRPLQLLVQLLVIDQEGNLQRQEKNRADNGQQHKQNDHQLVLDFHLAEHSRSPLKHQTARGGFCLPGCTVFSPSIPAGICIEYEIIRLFG
ncbi:hypothetical protein D3C75_1027750 [compost metagenome]